jgi:hypothetical protein
MARQVARPATGTQSGTRTCRACEVLSASRSNGTSSASSMVAATISAVARTGVAVLGYMAGQPRQIALPRHAIDHARGHRDLRQDGVERGDNGDGGDGEGAHARDGGENQAERRVRAGQLGDRHGGHRDGGDRDIQDGGHEQSERHGARDVAVRSLDLLDT